MIVVASLACEDTSHVYVGRLFVEERGCLGTATSVDVVEGDPPGECEPTCLAQSQSDGGRAIYVATMCPPFPFGFDVSGSDPACPDALAALARADTCRVDGGSTNPAPLRDAASD
jgi:hypothetical protein